MSIRIPRPYVRKDEDTPNTVFTFTRGSNNNTRATIRVLEYPNGEVCIQLEDKVSGAEMWGDWDDVLQLLDELSHIAADRHIVKD